jgi:hypothetical protein
MKGMPNTKKEIVADAEGKARGGVAPSAARRSNAETIDNKTVDYRRGVASAIQDQGDNVAGDVADSPGYLNSLAKATLTGANRAVVPNNSRDRIQAIYEGPYTASGQAQKSADEISGALQQATPQAATAQLGNIGGGIPEDAKNLDLAQVKLTVFANAIFSDPSCLGLYTDTEKDAVKKLVIGKAIEYFKAMQAAGEIVDPNAAMQLIRDNIIKIHHQQKVDHQVISGSDHGVRHVLQGNVANTLNALDDAQLSGLVSPKDKLMAMQIMIDHDLGYTLDAAKGSFDAAKDHPLASAAYLERGGQNSSIFTPEDQAFMRDAVLKHSYPFGLERPLDFSNEDAKKQAIANLISIVDAMGVTGDTKCPALYREVLSKADLERLARSDGPEVKEALHAIIDQAVKDGKISQEVAEGYHMALDYDASKYGAKMILPQFGGQLLGTKMEIADDERPPKHFALHLDFGVSEDIKILAGLFGNGDEVKAFGKMVGDITFLPTEEEIATTNAKIAQEEANHVPKYERTKPQTVTNLGQRAKAAETGTPQEMTTGGAVTMTLAQLEGPSNFGH